MRQTERKSGTCVTVNIQCPKHEEVLQRLYHGQRRRWVDERKSQNIVHTKNLQPPAT
jgi:hypothetical protein